MIMHVWLLITAAFFAVSLALPPHHGLWVVWDLACALACTVCVAAVILS